MPARSIELASNRLYQVSTFSGLDEPVDDDVNRMTITADRTRWDSLTTTESVASWWADISYDGGPFGPFISQTAAGTTQGGLIIGDGGTDYANSKWSFDVPEGISRIIRFTVEVHIRLRTQIQVDFLVI